MAPRHGITVHAGSNFARPAFTIPGLPSTPRLRTRASVQTTTARVTLIIIAVSLVVCGIFCCGVGLLIWKNKRNKKKRNQILQESRPFVHNQYNAVGDVNAATNTSMGYVQELPDDHQAYQMSTGGMKNELPAGKMAHNIDGFAAPPRSNTRPVELASNEAYQLPVWKA